HRLISEGFQELDLCRGKGANLGASCHQFSNEFPLLTKRNEYEGAGAADGTQSWEIILRAYIGNVEGAMPANPANRCFIRTNLDSGTRYRTKMSPQDRSVPLVESQRYIINPQTRAALSTIASSTGCTSVGERLMMPSTSAVAVWCSSASRSSALRSCNSLNNRTFSMAIAAWLAKVSSSLICLSLNGRTSSRRMRIAPMAFPSRSNGVAKVVCWPVAWTALAPENSPFVSTARSST